MHTVIFSGYNPRALMALMRTLKNQNLDFSIIAKSEEDDIFKTQYKNNVVSIRRKKSLELDDIEKCIEEIKFNKSVKECLIIPSTEALNRFLLDNRDYFETLGCKIPLPNKGVYETVSDKAKFSKFCQDNNVEIPQKLECKIENIPFVAKPKSYTNSENQIFSPVLITSEEIYNEFIKTHNLSDFYYQEYLNGESYYLLYYFTKNNDVIKFSQKNLVQQSGGKSIVSAVLANIHNDEISTVYENLFKKLNYQGLVMIELRKQQDTYYMIEANPRLWGPSQLFVDAKINFFEYFLADNHFDIKITHNDTNSDAKYFWNGGFNGDVVYLGINKAEFLNKYPDFFEYEIYNRSDSNEIFKKECKEKLVNNYKKISKHSNYQILVEDLYKYISKEELKIKSRSEKSRLEYMLKHINVKNKSIIDIGANTGYFSLELIKQGAQNVTCYEGNTEHTLFIQDSANLLNMYNKVKVHNEYFDFEKINKNSNKYDLMLLLNVLHHIGDDYGDKSLNIENARELIIKQLNNCAKITKFLIFQLGFNWKGNRNICLFEHGEKRELIEYIKLGTQDFWDIQGIGVAENNCDIIRYEELNDKNIARQDSLGEFLNRPIFIMKSKVI